MIEDHLVGSSTAGWLAVCMSTATVEQQWEPVVITVVPTVTIHTVIVVPIIVIPLPFLTGLDTPSYLPSQLRSSRTQEYLD